MSIVPPFLYYFGLLWDKLIYVWTFDAHTTFEVKRIDSFRVMRCISEAV